MIVDSSAILAVLFSEPESERLIDALSSAVSTGIGAPTLAETAIVLGSRIGYEKRGILFRFIQEFDVAVIPFGDLHWLAAVEAYERYGKGRHTAALNFGHCLTYAVARLANQPLLFVGNDFSSTDVEVVHY